MTLLETKPRITNQENQATAPTGGAWAAILATAIASICFAVLADLTEISAPIKKALTFHKGSGDLSGKSTLAIIVWLIAWSIFHARWKSRDIRRTGLIASVAVLLIVISLVLVFPPFVELFAKD